MTSGSARRHCRAGQQARSSMADEAEPQKEPSQEELMEQLEAEFKKLQVSDVLVQTVFTVSSLGYRSLGEETRDLEQAKLAIDSLAALGPPLPGAVPAHHPPRPGAE